MAAASGILYHTHWRDVNKPSKYLWITWMRSVLFPHGRTSTLSAEDTITRAAAARAVNMVGCLARCEECALSKFVQARCAVQWCP